VTAAGFQDVPFPTPAPDPAPPRRSPNPRNFLAAAEHRKLFWRIMPPAILAVVILELLTRSDGPPAPPREPQVDTRIEAVAGPPPAEDAVVIIPPDEDWDAADESLLSASPAALSKVRDATFFRQADEDAWLESMLTLEGYDGRRLEPPRNVGFTEVFGQPKSFRGRAVRMKGTLRGLEKLRAPANDYGIDDYFQGWLEPAGGPASPVIVHFREVPEGMPLGLEISEPVVVSGCFLKTMAYRARDAVRVAPLLLSRAPVRPAVAPAASEGGFWDLSLAAIGVVTMLAIVATIAFGFLVVGRSRTSVPAAAGLDEALADIEPFTVADSLRQVAAREAAGGDVASSSGGET
jgi:hypothetical protein